MLKDKILRLDSISEVDVECMFRLMLRYYDNLSKSKFLADLYQKDGVLFVHNSEQRICGFSTYKIFSVNFKGGQIKVLFSGDTVVEHSYWGRMDSAKAFMSLLYHCLENYDQPLYWFLLSKGIRTYRYLPLFFQEYYPAYDQQIPDYERELINYLSTRLFGDAFRKDQGIICFDPPSDRLKKEFVNLLDNKENDKYVRYFNRINPKSHLGDELPCIAKLTMDNLSRMSLRLLNGKAKKVLL